ncbi:MAG: transposase [Candidatus Gracilibacteria bacterium]|nr:transposase [Candidatus Gracilibacteria bacterium]
MISSFLVTWVTHNSRTNERMKELGIRKGTPLILNTKEEIEVTRYITEIVHQDQLKLLAYNICRDHVHIVLVCEEYKLTRIVNKLKAQSSRLFNINHRCTISGQGGMPPCLGVKIRGKTQTKLWAQKFNRRLLDTEDQFYNAIHYVQTNREKHDLP